MAVLTPPQDAATTDSETAFIGEGCCGKVYAVVAEDGTKTAAKYFSAMTIDRHWFAEFDARYRSIPGGHPGILPRYSADFTSKPNQCVSELVTGTDGGARSAKKLDSVAVWTEEAKIWPYLLDLASAMAFLHRHHVVHANLHPANVFVTQGEDSRVAVTDFGQGYLGKMHLAQFSEGLWFAPPEQLREPEGIALRHGYRWDVYRFGALSYWLITGDLPRGGSFAKQTKEDLGFGPSAAEALADVNPAAFAEAIEASDIPSWQKKPTSSRLAAFRQVIEACVCVDPDERPADMGEVFQRFLEIDAQAQIEDAENRVVAERERQKQKLRTARLAFAATSLTAVLAIYGVIHFVTANLRKRGDIKRLTAVVEQQNSELAVTDSRLMAARRDLRSSRASADRFFAGLAGSRTATNGDPGELIEVTLLESKSYYEELIESASESPEAAAEKSRAHHNLAQIDLKLRDPEIAAQGLKAATASLEALLDSHGEDARLAFDTHLRLAECHDLLARLIPIDPSEAALFHLSKAAQHLAKARSHQPYNPQLNLYHAEVDHRLAVQLHAQRRYAEAIETQVAAAKILQSIADDELDERRKAWLMANIQFDTSRSLHALDRNAEGIDSCLAALETLETVGPSQQGQKALLGRCYAELGSLFAEGKDAGNTRKVLAEAIRLLLPETAPGDTSPGERAAAALYLSRSYRQMAEIENAAGKWSTASQLYGSAVDKLDEFTKESFPQHLEVRLTLAEMLTTFARHSGDKDKSVSKRIDHAHSLAENVRESLSEGDDLIGSGAYRTRQLQLAQVYSELGDISRKMSDTNRAKICYEVAVNNWTLLAGVDSAAWIQERLAQARSQLEQVRQ